jgi:uncharacterized protein
LIIDADCHISSRKFDQLSLTADDLLAQMDRTRVDRALVWLRPSYTRDIDPENRAIYQAAQAHPDRLIGFGWANPRLGMDHCTTQIRTCLEDYNLSGIKFNGAQDEYVIDDLEILPLIELAASYHKPIAFHIGADSYENTHPYRLGHIAALFPDTSFLMVHMGGAGTPSLYRAAIETAHKQPNITLIGSAIDERPILAALQQLGTTRLCFGSDSPFGLMHVRLAMYTALLRDFNETDKNLVLGGNLARILG